jgi:hypothetical protein
MIQLNYNHYRLIKLSLKYKDRAQWTVKSELLRIISKDMKKLLKN